MNFSGVKCDECGRLKGEANHWHAMLVHFLDSGEKRIELGVIGSSGSNGIESWEVHDLCGEQCFYKHIGKLLRLNPTGENAEA